MLSVFQVFKAIGRFAVPPLVIIGGFAQCALAQSQFEATVITSQGKAASGNLDAFMSDQIDTYATGASAAAQGLGPAAKATGRIRRTEHDGFSANPNIFAGNKTYGAEIKEASGFGSLSLASPGLIFGGHIRFGMMAGATNLTVESKPNTANPAPAKGSIGSADIDSAMFGGSVLWYGDIGYISAAVVAFTGDTTMSDKFLPGVITRFQQSSSGTSSSLTIGRTFPITPGDNTVKLDLRGSYGFTRATTSALDANPALPGTSLLSFEYETSSLSFSPMLFADLKAGDVNIRPFVQGTVRKLFDYTNKSRAYGAFIPGTVYGNYDEARLFGTIEAGINASYQNWQFGLSVYTEQSDDSDTIGGKIGGSYQFN